MKFSLFKRVLTAGVVYWFAVGFAFAATLKEEDQSLLWKSWLKTQIENNPEIVAARQQLKARQFLADGRTQPLYNPELKTDFEHQENSDNYRVGINQTLDVWGKRDSRSQQAEFLRLAAEQSYAQTYQKNSLRRCQCWRLIRHQKPVIC